MPRSPFDDAEENDGAVRMDGALLPVIDLSQWSGDPPEREFAWGTWLPLRQTTLLSGKGGAGKSLLAQQLATHIALGEPFLGMETSRTAVAYMTCEDDVDELWRRQCPINDKIGAQMGDLAGRLHLVSLCGEMETALAVSDDGISITETSLWRAVVDLVERENIGVFIFDNATDALAGDMNATHVVASFVQMLTGLAMRTDSAALLLHHPNKRGDDFAGNEAWHNKVRSRLILKYAGDGGDADQRTLENPKANYGPQGGKIDLRWLAGAFTLESEVPDGIRETLASTSRAAGDNAVFLACLEATNAQRRQVSPNVSAAYAPTRFADMPESKGIGKVRLKAAMERLFHLQEIEHAELWKGADRKPVKGLRVTCGPRAGDVAKSAGDDRPNDTWVPGD